MITFPSLSRPTVVTLSLLPVFLPTAYLIFLKAVVSQNVASSVIESRVPSKKKDGKAAAASTKDLQITPPHSLPDDVLGEDSPYAVFCERVVSRPVPLGAVKMVEATAGALTEQSEVAKTTSLLTTYTRGTMEAFSWTPQAFVIRSLISDNALRRTFDSEYTRALSFNQDNVTNGVYQVTYRGQDKTEDNSETKSTERIEFSAIPVLGHPEFNVHVIIVSEIQRSATELVFANETWMWRHVPGERPTLMEGTAGRWLHTLLAGWLITRGTQAVRRARKAKSE